MKHLLIMNRLASVSQGIFIGLAVAADWAFWAKLICAVIALLLTEVKVIIGKMEVRNGVKP